MADDTFTIDGDKVVAFINAVEGLGSILNQMNVIEVKEAFWLGKSHMSIDAIIKVREQWLDALRQVRTAIKTDLECQEGVIRDQRDCIAHLRSLSNVANSPDYKHAMENLERMCGLLDRLRAHKESGLLQALEYFGVKNG